MIVRSAANWRRNFSGSALCCMARAHRRTPAAHPSVRSTSSRIPSGETDSPCSPSSASASSRVNRRSAWRISVISPAAR